MYGVEFFNNNDLRRILTDYNFKGHPLRKDFPLSGFFEVSYLIEFAAVIYQRIELMQELRFYVDETN
jgi:NADH-quinone oxidoreductase subunit C